MADEKTPLISVITGVLYRRSDLSLLQRSVESILDQSMSDFELLICDDGSTAEAQRYLDEQAQKDGRLRLLRGCERTDLAAKLNFCLASARGRYIARMDDDDRSHPDRLEKQVRFLEENKEISFVGCNVACIKEDQPRGEWRFPTRPKVEDFYLRQPYIHPTLMFRRETLEAVGGYSEDARCELCEDYDLLLRLYQAGSVGANIQEDLLDYTVSDGSNRKMRHRLNEAVTRYRRFKDLGKLPGAWPYVVKPIAVGLLPKGLVSSVKNACFEGVSMGREHRGGTG